MKKLTTLVLTTLVAACSYAPTILAQPPAPAIEYSSLLDNITVKFRGQSGRGDTGGRLVFGQRIMGVFFPKPDNWAAGEPQRSGGHELTVELHKSGSDKSLMKYACDVRRSGGSPFSFVAVRDNGSGYTFDEPGEYELRFAIDGTVITKMPFKVDFIKNDADAFDTRTYNFIDGDWSRLAYLHYGADKPESPLDFFTWTRIVAFSTTPETVKMDVTLMQGDDVIAVTPQGIIGWPEWQFRQATFQFPANQGGRVFNNTDLLKRTGKHTIRVDVDGKPHQYFNFEVADGKVVPHSRQVMNYEPREDWLCPRRVRVGLEGTGHVFWLDRAEKADSKSPAKVAGPSATAKAKWMVKPNVDSARPFQIKHTKISMRKDRPYSIGDGFVAYATGTTTGVGYFTIGEDKPKGIPGGQKFRSDLFFACGKLILMTTRNNISVFSTENGRSVDIPDDEIHLAYQTGALYGPKYVHADGYLVATVNEPATLKNKTVINVIDLSGDNKPLVIPIKNADFETRHVTSVRVNARIGKVAVGSEQKGAIYVADVAPMAEFKKYDVSGFDSYGENDMVLTDSHIVYTDAAAFANVRKLDLNTGEVTTPDASQYGGGWGTVAASNGELIAWAIKEPRASWAIGELTGEPAPLPNTREKSNLGGLRLGQGRSMAMAEDGTVFIAGTQSISTSQCLQAAQNGKWQVVPGDDGQPIPAIDVISGNSMIVFKTGKPSTSSEVKVSYATFGKSVVLPSATAPGDDGTKGANASDNNPPKEEMPDANTKSAEKPVGERKLTEAEMSALRSLKESEETVYNALKNTFTPEEARRRAREAANNFFKESEDYGHLKEIYERDYEKGWGGG